MELKLSDDQLKSLVSEAILNAINQEQRAILIKEAIQHLLQPKDGSGYHGQRMSPLQDSFNIAVQRVAHDICRDALENNADIKEQIRALVAESFRKALVDERSSTVERVTEGIVRAMQCHS